ncbi:MAG: FtsW/RodA/SpoVE family cell cycle protein [Bacilli bacterium]|nr:FtsW/RodA/SpoVE family cell cycle protein [Bacilli bacterium]
MRNKINLRIVIPILLLSIISIVSIYSASLYTSPSMGNLTLKQTIWYLVGVVLVAIILRVKNDYIFRHSWILYIAGNILLLGLLLFGQPINNSRCWIVIPGIGSVQPSEFMKVILMLVLATMIHNFRSDYKNPNMLEEFIFLIKSFIVVLIPSILTFLEPDTGCVFMYLIIYVAMIFASGIRLRWFITAFIVGTLLLGGILWLYFYKENIFISIFGSSIYYRLERIFDWKNGSGLQLENALAAIGSAGLFGHGFNHTPIYFPEASTDFIFAVYASNFGYVGVVILLLIIAYLDFNIILLTRKKTTDTNQYVIAGIIGMLLFQQVENIGMTVGLLPITGITLPFVSYGGSSLLSYMLLVGLILNVSNEKERTYRYK